jgi:hypothetical protein
MSRYRRSQSFPAFSNDDYDPVPGRQPDPGDGPPETGDPWGVWGGGYMDWDLDTITDTSTAWAITLFLVSQSTFANDIPDADTATTDVSVRRPQNFSPPAGRHLTWTLTRLSDQELLQSGEVVVDAEGLVTVCGLTLSKDPARLEIALKNRAPVLDAIGDRSVDEGEALSFTLSASDPDLPAQALTFGATGLPAGATLNPETGAFSWTPTEAQGPDKYTITFTVSDGSATDSETIEITVGEVNRPPVLAAINDREVDEGSTLSFTLSATDPDEPAQTLSFSAAGLPEGATLNPETGAFSWTPTEAQGPDKYTITFTVSDGTAGDSEAVEIVVKEVNTAPEISSASPESPFEMNAGEAQVFEIWPHDDDGDVLTGTWKLDGVEVGDGGMTYAYSTSNDDAGPHNLEVTVSDGKGGTAAHNWAITVKPTTPIVALDVAELKPVAVQGSDAPDGSFTVTNAGTGTLSYSVTWGDCAWLSCSPETGSSVGDADAITVRYDTDALSSGTFAATITVSGGEGVLPVQIPVSLTVTSAGDDDDDDDDDDGGGGGGSGGGGGGGCAMAAGKGGDPLSFFLPYLAAGVVMLALRLKPR